MENKQETLEEAAEKYENKDQHQRSKLDFIEGAKWQAERMYSEEDMKSAIKIALYYWTKNANTETEAIKDIFEQFKKK